MPDRGHSYASRESQSASEKNSRVADIRSQSEQSCANPTILGDWNFASVPILKVIGRTERRWNLNSTKRDDLLS